MTVEIIGNPCVPIGIIDRVTWPDTEPYTVHDVEIGQTVTIDINSIDNGNCDFSLLSPVSVLNSEQIYN